MGLGIAHCCPVCKKRHQAWTQMCRQCRIGAEYEPSFASRHEKERFEDAMARIRHEEKRLRAAGYDPNNCPAAKADRILKII